MPLAEESIIAPGPVAHRAPLKRSTVAWLVALVLVFTVLGVFAPRLLGSMSGPVEPVPDEKPPITGRVRDIDSEFEWMQRQPPKVETPPPVVGPLPDSIAPSAEKNQEVEIDAAGRTSKSLAHDFSSSGSGNALGAPSSLEQQLRGLLPSPVTASSGAIPTNPADLVKSVIEAQQRGQAGSQPTDEGWLKGYSASLKANNAPLKPYPITNPYTLVQGKVIPAVLGRNINTDLPGQITACTTIDVYDSITSDYLLIPKGSCLSGQYSSGIRAGQERVMFAFSRIVMPNGTSFDLPGNPGSDLGGAAGIEGEVNNHFFQMFSSSLLIALLANRIEGDNSGSTTNIGTSSGTKSAAGQVLVDTSKQVLDRYRLIPPTIEVERGTRINVEVTQDMGFPGPYQAGKR